MMSLLPWILFLALILLLLAVDLGVFNRKAHVVSMRESFAWTAVWISLALAFNVLVYFAYEHHWFGIGQHVGHDLGGREAAIQFFTGYLIEESLSVDNIFVMALIFARFSVPQKYQHRALFWGILGALVMRGAMIGAGTALIQRFDWITYVFGGLLLFTAARMMIVHHDELEPGSSWLVRLVRRFIRVTDTYDGSKFFTRVDGRRAATLLFVVVVAIEGADVMFAVDSIPAIFAVTTDPFIVFTSNIFAILGLRSLYFALAAAMEAFHFVQASLVSLLAFIGMKMLLAHYFEIPAWVSLCVIAGILVVGVLASVWVRYFKEPEDD